MNDSQPAVSERTLTVVADEMQAEMIRALLEAHDIRSVVRSTPLGQVQWGVVNTGMGGPRELVVAERDLAAARELLSSESQIGDVGVPDAEAREAAVSTVDLDAQSRRLNRWWIVVIMLLFGVPLAIGLTATILDAISRM